MQLLPSVYLVGSGSLGFDLTSGFDCHVYLLHSRGEAALIDAGSGISTDDILQRIRAAGVRDGDLRYLLLTHGHADHAGGAASLKHRLPDLTVCASPPVAGWLRAGDAEAISLDAGRRAGFYPEGYTFSACPVDRELADGEAIRIGAAELRVVSTDGHSDGHLCFSGTIDERRVLFAGDLVFHGGQISLQNTWDCRIPAYATSMKRFASARVDALLPGHLTPSLQRGQRHIDEANALFNQIHVPRAIF